MWCRRGCGSATALCGRWLARGTSLTTPPVPCAILPTLIICANTAWTVLLWGPYSRAGSLSSPCANTCCKATTWTSCWHSTHSLAAVSNRCI